MVRHNLYDQQLDLLMATRDSLYFFLCIKGRKTYACNVILRDLKSFYIGLSRHGSREIMVQKKWLQAVVHVVIFMQVVVAKLKKYSTKVFLDHHF